ncbi:MAG: hypothetical protein ACO1SV_11420 [Fimbriimonas sp.]
MIETPIVGRYQGEDRRLIFGPPALYHAFVTGVGIVGGLFLVASLVPNMPLWPGWWLMVGALTIVAATLAAFSLQLVVFDLKEGFYRRRQGPGMLPRRTYGKLTDLDAVVVIAQPNAGLQATVTYYVVLHWKVGLPEPILVLHQDTRVSQPGLPLNAMAGPVLKLGERYAKSLGVKFFDNTYFASPCPVPIW